MALALRGNALTVNAGLIVLQSGGLQLSDSVTLQSGNVAGNGNITLGDCTVASAVLFDSHTGFLRTTHIRTHLFAALLQRPHFSAFLGVQ